MTIDTIPIFERQRAKLVSSGRVSQEQLDETLSRFVQNPRDKSLHFHNIHCKKDKGRRSIAVVGTRQTYKVLLSLSKNEEYATLVFIGHHDDYDRLNKDC